MLRSDGKPASTPPADRRGHPPQASSAAPRRLPLRFPTLIAALAAFSLTLFAGYTAHLQHAAAAAVAATSTHPHSPPHTKRQEAQQARDAVPSPPPRSRAPPRAATAAPTTAAAATDAPAAEVAYAAMWASRPTQEQWDTWTKPITLRYDPEPTQDPRGAALGRAPNPTVVTDGEGRIHTPDRRRARIRPMVPLVEGHDERFPRQRRVEEETDWLLVIGIPSIDTDKGARRRGYQRGSWQGYPNVYNPRSGDGSSGSRGATVLVKYLLAAHPSHDYAASSELVSEARKEKDVLYFDMKEGVWGEKKKSWAVEVGMSRKAYAWYCFAADNLRFTYLMKGDDDEFVRARLLEAELRALPTVNKVYYGRVMKWGVRKGSRSSFPFAGGMSITMSYDLVDWIRDSQSVEGAVDYYHEDVMVGRWFYNAGVPLLLVSDCRHHDIHSGANKQKITSSSLCVHHLAVCFVSPFFSFYCIVIHPTHRTPQPSTTSSSPASLTPLFPASPHTRCLPRRHPSGTVASTSATGVRSRNPSPTQPLSLFLLLSTHPTPHPARTHTHPHHPQTPARSKKKLHRCAASYPPLCSSTSASPPPLLPLSRRKGNYPFPPSPTVLILLSSPHPPPPHP